MKRSHHRHPSPPIKTIPWSSPVIPVKMGAVRGVVVANPFGEHFRTPLGINHSASPTRVVNSSLYPRGVAAPWSKPTAKVVLVHMDVC
jgi:hypothetical protein